MRLQLILLALSWAPAFAQYSCTLCKDGAGLTKPDGMVTTNEGQTLNCVELTQQVMQLSGSSCESLQRLAMEPCGCPFYEYPRDNVLSTGSSSIGSVASTSVLVTPESDSFACSICASGQMTRPSAFTIDSAGMPISCQQLHDTRGSIPESACGRIQSFAAIPCGCDGDAPTTIDTILGENPTTFTCSICGNGVIGNPDGIVFNDRGVARTCAALEADKASIPSSMCPTLQNSALEPCECDFSMPAQETTNDIPFSPFTPATDAEMNSNAILEVEVMSQCSICGDGEMTIPSGIVTNRNGRTARCDVLDSNPKEITLDACANIQAISQQPCGCIYPFQGATVDILDDIVPFECSICGEGSITIPDGVVITPEGQAARCDALQANGKTIPEDICPEIQQLSNSPCGCTDNVETASWVGQDTDESGVCHVCGGPAQKIGNQANMVATPTGMFTCHSLLNAGLGGAISTEDCGTVQSAVKQECGCYVDVPTPAPSDIFQCNICVDDMYVTNPEGIIDNEKGMTCAQYQEEATRGRIDEDQCSVLHQMSGEACGCQPPPTFPTNAPTSYACQVCGVGREVGLLDAMVTLPNYQKMTCATLQERALTGGIHYSQCARFVPLAQEYCRCTNKRYDASAVAPSNYDCNICGPGQKAKNTSGVVAIPNQPDRTCIELMTEAAYGNIDENTCSLLHPFTKGPCECEDRYATEPDSLSVPTQSPSVKHGDCFQDLGEIQALERGIQDTSIARMYTLCPDTTFDLGVWTEEGEMKDGQPFIALRPNAIYQCGHDGSRTNNCILKGGDFGLASYYEVYDGIYEAVPGVQIRGLTFESQNLFSVILKSAGDITFTGCAFKGNSNNVPVLLQWEGEEDILSENRRIEELEELKQVVTFQDCVFRDNFVDDSLSFPGIIENTFNSELSVKNCLFQGNVYGSSDNLAGTGYAIRSFGPLTLESTCFIDNIFLNNGPVLVYGAQFSAYDNYVESSQTDLNCELAALFSSQDDMAKTTPSCESSDASVCAFTQGPTSSPTMSPDRSSTGTSQANQAASSATSVMGRRLFSVVTTVLPLWLTFSSCL